MLFLNFCCLLVAGFKLATGVLMDRKTWKRRSGTATLEIPTKSIQEIEPAN